MSHRARTSLLPTLAAACAVAAGVLATTPSAVASPSPVAPLRTAAVAAPVEPGDDPLVQRRLDRLVSRSGFPGVIASVRGRDGIVRTYTAGTGDLRTGAPVPVDGRVRIASNTKMFTATVIRQLVAEGKVDLGAVVDTYLPGVLRGGGNDGRQITVLQLLQQTSGLPDYDQIVARSGSDLQAVAQEHFRPQQLLDAALAERRSFAPGTKWEYSNTNYIVLGLLAEQVTGRSFGAIVTRRVIDRIGLEDTYWPSAREQKIRGSHPHGYWADEPGAAYEDITRMDPALGWAAGQLVSTPADLGRFMDALLGGELLPPAQLAAMQTTVRAPRFDAEPGWRYGLGIARHTLSCGDEAWGHGGDIQGYETRNLATSDGRWAVVTVTALPTSLKMLASVSAAVETAVCRA